MDWIYRCWPIVLHVLLLLSMITLTVKNQLFYGKMSAATAATYENCGNALVPYVKPMIFREFYREQRTITIAGRVLTFRQNWHENGIAGVLWDAGIVLARYISDHPETVFNRSVLELGAGLGLPSIVATYLHVKFVHTTDRATALPLLKENVRQNANAKCKIEIYPFDWNTDKMLRKYEVILGADLIYDSVLLKPLIKALVEASDKDTAIYLCSRIRYRKDKDFYDQLRQEHFAVEEIFHETGFDVHIFKIMKLTTYYHRLTQEENLQGVKTDRNSKP